VPRKAASSKPWFTNQSLSVAWSSEPYNLDYQSLVGITMSTAGVTSNQGTFVLEASNDLVTWYTLDVKPPMVLANVDNDFEIHLSVFPYRYGKMTFTPSGVSPDGVISSIISAKAEC
jgi:hypothetical protein